MFDLTGKNALVTGASGGIGAEIARVLHGAGATVALSGTRVDPLESLAAELGDRAHVVPCNLSDMEAVAALPNLEIEPTGGHTFGHQVIWLQLGQRKGIYIGDLCPTTAQ